MKNKRIYIGGIGVDSGQILITDPCYVKDFDNNEFTDPRVFIVKKSGKEYRLWQNFQRFDEVIEDGKTMNELLGNGEAIEHVRTVDNSYSYNGASQTTIYEKLGGGELGNRLGVAMRTADGDGEFPVYAVYDTDGAVKEVVICFR